MEGEFLYVLGSLAVIYISGYVVKEYLNNIMSSDSKERRRLTKTAKKIGLPFRTIEQEIPKAEFVNDTNVPNFAEDIIRLNNEYLGNNFK
jgi:hypothetical protein